MTTALNRSFHHGNQPQSEIEITGIVVFPTSSEGSDMSTEVIRGLHSRPRVNREPSSMGEETQTRASFLYDMGPIQTTQ